MQLNWAPELQERLLRQAHPGPPHLLHERPRRLNGDLPQDQELKKLQPTKMSGGKMFLSLF